MAQLPHFPLLRRRHKTFEAPPSPRIFRIQRLDALSIWIPLYINYHSVTPRGLRWLLLNFLAVSTSRVPIFSILTVHKKQ